MSTSRLEMDRMTKLMAYADGELEGDERLEVEKLIATDVDAARFVRELGTLGDYVRMGHEDAVAPAIAKVDLTSAIMDAVAKEKIAPHAAAPVTNVSSLDAARARRRKIGAAVVAALALAASVFVMTRQKTEAPLAKAPATAEPPAVVAATGGAGVEVEAVESKGHSVSVFYLPSANELSTSVVVWVDETGEK